MFKVIVKLAVIIVTEPRIRNNFISKKSEKNIFTFDSNNSAQRDNLCQIKTLLHLPHFDKLQGLTTKSNNKQNQNKFQKMSRKKVLLLLIICLALICFKQLIQIIQTCLILTKHSPNSKFLHSINNVAHNSLSNFKTNSYQAWALDISHIGKAQKHQLHFWAYSFIPKITFIDPELGQWDESRKYKIFVNGIVGLKFSELSLYYNVTLATMVSMHKLYYLTKTLARWTGPVSVSGGKV